MPAASNCRVEVVDALYTASVQAMVNSLQHADEPGRRARRELRVRGVRASGCVIEVSDNGVGFDRAAVPAERLGLRVSIEERMANAGGTADIVSQPGHGTTVTVAWPRRCLEQARGGRRMITIPRWLLLLLGALFSGVPRGARRLLARHSGVAVAAPSRPSRVYSIATVLSLWPGKRMRMPDWLAAFDLAVAIVLPLLVTSQLDPDVDNRYATWYVAAVGTLMTIAAARRQLLVAWVGVIALAVQTVVWAGPLALATLGVIGSIVWVAIAHTLTSALTSAGRETRRYAQAEREAAAWQAAQDAHLFEGRMRLGQTERLAAPMLRRIADRDGRLTDTQRAECRTLEASIRDEIRGRMLLTDAVRTEVRRARERGIVVTLLDEGGIDDLDEATRDRVLSRLAEAIAASNADRIIARTAAVTSPAAVTVVGLVDPTDARDRDRRGRGRALARDPARARVG